MKRAISFALGFALFALGAMTADASAGGGFVGAGIAGQYFNNTALSGSAAFTRNDVRVDFDWGMTGLPGGSSSPGFSSIGSNAFSASWTGQIVAKYSEIYTFKTISTGGVSVMIETGSGSTWTPVINDWAAHATTTDTGTFGLAAGQIYNIKMQYFNDQTNAVARLHWSSPSTPEEAIEAATNIGINGGTAVDYDTCVMFADAMKMARISSWSGNNNAALDSNGWPAGDGNFYLYAGQNTDTSGLWTITFTGQAAFGIGLVSYTNLTQSYNAGSNTTTVTFQMPQPAGTFQVTLGNTRRLPADTTATGITNLRIMRPVAPGNLTASYPANTLFTSAFKTLLSKFTAIRFMDYFAMNTNANSVVQWSDLISPGYSSQAGINGGYQGQGGAIQYAIELCNETGRDFWLNIPIQANNAFITKLAQGVLYGFDATGTPYTSPRANPVYPPLEPNLRVYLEYSNETWNYGFNQTSLAGSLAAAAVNSSTPDGQILNYDGINNPGVWTHRWVILRAKEISDLFRGVFGDAAMLTTVRPLFLYQYANANNTAADAFVFLDNYFNNADGGSHVGTPHPVNYYLYGGGGGWYNSVNNSSGLGEATVPNNSFETPALVSATSQINPAGSSWIFSGVAGLVSNNPNIAADAVSTTLGALATPAGDTIGVGCVLTVGAQNIYVSQLGRYVAPGNGNSHGLYLLDGTSPASNLLASTSVNTSGSAAGQYIYGDVGCVRLLAGHSYAIVSSEPTYSWISSYDSYYDQGSSQSVRAGVTVAKAVMVDMPQGEWTTSTWAWTTGSAGHVSGPVDFKYFTAPGGGPVAYAPRAADGSQAAFIEGSGTLSQTITVPSGVSDFTFYAAEGAAGGESFDVFVDGTALPRDWRTDFTPDNPYFSQYRTATGLELSAGQHSLTFVASGTGAVFIDDVVVESADAMLGNGIEDLGPTARSEADWDLAYGLRTAGYEGGFEVGGDNPIAASYAADVDPRVEAFTATTLGSYLAAGGDLPIVFNASGGAYAVAADIPYGTPDVYSQNTPKMAAYQAASGALPAAVTNASRVPRVLTVSNITLFMSDSDGRNYADAGGNVYLDGGWLSWNVNVPASGTYSLTGVTTGSGGSYVILMDENPVASGSSGGNLTGSISLSPGLHCIKTRSTGSNAFLVTSLTVQELGAPAAPTLTTAIYTNAECALAWSAVSGAANYVVAYGNAPGGYTSFVNAGQNLSTVLSGLDNSNVYYIAVYASNAAGELSLLSNEERVASRSTDPQLLVTFEDQPLGNVQALYNYGVINFTAGGNTGTLQIQGTSEAYWPGQWPSQVLSSMDWGNSHFITNASGGTFDLYSLDLLVINQTGSALITGYDPSGFTITKLVNFGTYDANGHAAASVTLDWVKMSQVEISWWANPNAGGGGRFGTIDNVLFDTTQSVPGAPSNLVATVSSNGVSLAWNRNSANESGFIIDRSTSSDFSQNLVSFVAAAGSTSYADGSASSGVTYYYRIRAISGGGDSTDTAAAQGLYPLQHWRLANFGTIANAGQAADTASPAGDGVPNLLNYALGLNPLRAGGRASTPMVSLSAGKAQLTFPCNAACSDITYIVESSSDLKSWTDIARSAGGAVTVPLNGLSTVSDPGSGARNVTVTSTQAPGSGLFLRLKVTNP